MCEAAAAESRKVGWRSNGRSPAADGLETPTAGRRTGQPLQQAHHPLPPSISSSRLTVPPRPLGYCPGGPPAPLRPPAACLDLAPLPLAEPAGGSRWYSDGVSMICSGE